ncbi:MAG: hypothetical protein V3V08_12865 [Nannocystaceae bacterium]
MVRLRRVVGVAESWSRRIASPSCVRTLVPLFVFGAIALSVAGLVFTYELDPKSRLPESRLTGHWVLDFNGHWAFATGALIALVGVLGYAIARHFAWFRCPALQRGLLVVLSMTVFASGVHFFYSEHGIKRPNFAHGYDAYHYLLGPKYYRELSYDDLYNCTAAVLNRRGLKPNDRVRDLHTYLHVRVDRLDTSYCRDRFSKARWEEWGRDVRAIRKFMGARRLRRAMGDRGYNGSPLHALLAGSLGQTFEVSHANLAKAALLDIFALCLMMLVVCRSFGLRLGLIFALFFFVNAADGFFVIGTSWFRYIWMVALGAGLACMRRNAYALAGILLATSALLNVFPAVFSLAVVLKAGHVVIIRRHLPRRYKRFLAAAALTTVFGLGAASSFARGITNHVEFAENLQKHDVIGRFPGFGTGLKYLFGYCGHKLKEERKNCDENERQRFERLEPFYWGLAAAMVLWAWVLALRLDDIEASVLVGFTTFFCLLGTTGYYFCAAAVVILMWHRRIRSRSGPWFLALFLLANLVAQWAWIDSGYFRFVHNTVISGVWTAFLILTLAWLTIETRLKSRRGSTGVGISRPPRQHAHFRNDSTKPRGGTSVP